MAPDELNVIKERYEAAKAFPDAFRKVINTFDPIANSPLTGENTPTKILADWARKACQLMDNSDSLDCIAEIERLRKLVKSAHREGFAAIEGFAKYDVDDYLWDHSEARKALEAK